MDTQVKLLAAALVVMSTLGGCAAFPARLTGNMCSEGPILGDPGASTRWTRFEKQQITAHNDAGETICGWKAPSK